MSTQTRIAEPNVLNGINDEELFALIEGIRRNAGSRTNEEFVQIHEAAGARSALTLNCSGSCADCSRPSVNCRALTNESQTTTFAKETAANGAN